MLSHFDKKIIGLVSQDMLLIDAPFRDLAEKSGIKEEEFINRLKAYKKQGLMRKFSAVLNHRRAGFIANAMCVWDIPEKSVVKAGRIISSFPEVSHCYERRRAPGWNYNLYAMVHGKTKRDCLRIARKISKEIGRSDCKILFSSKEFKKTGLRYEKII